MVIFTLMDELGLMPLCAVPLMVVELTVFSEPVIAFHGSLHLEPTGPVDG